MLFVVVAGGLLAGGIRMNRTTGKTKVVVGETPAWCSDLISENEIRNITGWRTSEKSVLMQQELIAQAGKPNCQLKIQKADDELIGVTVVILQDPADHAQFEEAFTSSKAELTKESSVSDLHAGDAAYFAFALDPQDPNKPKALLATSISSTAYLLSLGQINGESEASLRLKMEKLVRLILARTPTS